MHVKPAMTFLWNNSYRIWKIIWKTKASLELLETLALLENLENLLDLLFLLYLQKKQHILWRKMKKKGHGSWQALIITSSIEWFYLLRLLFHHRMTWLHAAPNPNGILTSPLLGLVLPSMDGAASGSHAQHNVRASLSTESRGHAHTHSYAKSKISGLFYYLVRKSKITYQECHLGHVAQENREDQEFLEHSCNQYTRELHHLKQKSFISCSTPVMPKLNVLHTLL